MIRRGYKHIVNYFRKLLVKIAGKILDKYDYQYIDINSKIMIKDTIYRVDSLSIDMSDNQFQSVWIDAMAYEKNEWITRVRDE